MSVALARNSRSFVTLVCARQSGVTIEALEIKTLEDGTVRVRYADGWVNMTSSDGRQILEPVGAAPKAAAAVAAPAPSASSDRAAAYGVSSSKDRGNVMDVLRANRAKAAAEEAMQEPEAGAAGNAAADAGADAEEAAPTSADIKLGKYEVKFKTVIRAGVAKDSDKAGLVKVRPTIA